MGAVNSGSSSVLTRRLVVRFLASLSWVVRGADHGHVLLALTQAHFEEGGDDSPRCGQEVRTGRGRRGARRSMGVVVAGQMASRRAGRRRPADRIHTPAGRATPHTAHVSAMLTISRRASRAPYGGGSRTRRS